MDDNSYLNYMEKRYHDAISLYDKAAYDKDLKPIISSIL
jgi:hypothetical protein